METIHVFWAASLIAAGWLLPIGIWRMMAYRSGQVDHTSGMRGVAVMALGLGIFATVMFVVLTIWIASGS
ncbi:hypothetical protein BJ980_000095 [Nocardioides daedukensis]|uniref:Uncharacterized protein n=1 Tax=Nocardioides daedukensis TaxID=634462 RepID=A0A7Y9RV35_9ACTN|nr:hypothetical protein [Nocardioides daedukensis]NYG57172.1 hypothetical protein [Nocardioides daedukensis]